MNKPAAEPTAPLSELEPGRDRFVGRVLADALSSGHRTASEFLEWFPPSALVSALAPEVGLRVKLLVQAARVHHRIAARKSLRAAIEDLELALDEGVTTPDAMLELVPVPLLVRHLDPSELWSFATAGDWLEREGRDDTRRAAARVKLVVDAALAEGLLRPGELASGLPPRELASGLGAERLREAFAYAVESARKGKALDEARLLELAGVAGLGDGEPPPRRWARLVLGLALERAELATVPRPARLTPRTARGASSAPPAPPAAHAHAAPAPRVAPPEVRRPSLASTPNPRPAPVPEAVSPRPAPKPAPAPASRPGPKLAPAPRTASAPRPSVAPRPSASPHRPLAEALPPRAPLDTEPEEVDSDDLLEEDLTSPGVSAAEETPLELARRTEPPPAEPRAARIRQDVTELLGRIGRLPPNSEYLSLAILRSMALMYEHMKTRRTKAQRAQTVRDSFDNEAHLRIAMTALITMLDASATSGELDKLSPDTLVDRLLREERSIWQRSKRSAEDVPDALPSRRAVHVKAHGPPPSRR